VPPVDRVRELSYPAPEKSGGVALRAPLGLTSLLPTDDRPNHHEVAMTLAKNRIFELESRLANLEGELPQVKERGRLEGEEGGRRKQAEEHSQTLVEARSSIVAAIEGFAAERKEYFRGVEAEAVKLALAIARKILHRETQMDPLLLRSVVRSAMDRLEDTSPDSGSRGGGVGEDVYGDAGARAAHGHGRSSTADWRVPDRIADGQH
jgi:hypothetical protein